MSVPATILPTVRSGHQRATRIVFLVAGAAMSAWAPLVPFAKTRADVSDGMLGIVLLCFGAGSLIAMPLAGRCAAQFGCRVVILAAGIAACTTLPLLAVAASPASLAATLLSFGACLGALDVSMNLQAIAVERDAGRPMMSGFHALFSIGGIAGSLAMSAMLSAGLAPLSATLAVAALLAGVVASTSSTLVARRSADPGPMFGIPRGSVLLIGVLCFACFLMEGAMLDWSAVLLSSARGLDVTRAGIGYAAFSTAMVVGRLTGERVVQHFGRRPTLVTGALCAACGAAVIAFVPDWRAAVAAFTVVGLGCANIVPILFTAAGRQTLMPDSLALPAVTTIGYAGLLAGPAAIGLVAGPFGLANAFGLLALLMAACAALGRALPR